MRDFLYSEVGNFLRIQNIPDYPDLALANGRMLCQELLEPLVATFGSIAIRSGYRSSELNSACNKLKLGCASNESNFGRHIWDVPSASGHGAMACIVVPWFCDQYEAGADWRDMAYWIHDHLGGYSELEFFPNLCAFNIGWHQTQRKSITSYIPSEREFEFPEGAQNPSGMAAAYRYFPPYKNGAPLDTYAPVDSVGKTP